MQKFLGLANHYRQFVKDFAKIARLLYNSSGKADIVIYTEGVSRCLKRECARRLRDRSIRV